MPPDPSKRSSWRARLSRVSDQLVAQQSTKARLLLASLPGATLFLIAGASPMVAFTAGLAIALILFGPRVRPITPHTTKEERQELLAGAAILALACGVQVVIWARGLSDEQALPLLLSGGLGLLAALALVEAVRWAVRRARGH